MLNEAAYRERYKVPRTTLHAALIAGRVRGAVRETNGKWIIPEGALSDYAPGKLPEDDYPDYKTVSFHILKALNSDRFISAEILRCTGRFFSDVLCCMVDEGLIAASEQPFDGVTSCGYRLTAKGRECASYKKKEAVMTWIKNLKPVININLTIPN